ncbi:uncharacterized protein LOC143358206 [Halictus rubicundus]|uniref:uncharacterized protein LOC143358206 n=1 Tax=Halictus rubicundus TaxID=77578 RepID=UPI004035DABD
MVSLAKGWNETIKACPVSLFVRNRDHPGEHGRSNEPRYTDQFFLQSHRVVRPASQREPDMYRKIRLGFLAVIFLVCLILDSGTQAQLNFSTGWGKRSERRGGVVECGSGVAPKLEQLLNVYFLIQMEAQKMLDCRKLNE